MRTESIAAHPTTVRDQGFLTNGQMLGGNVVQVSHRTLSSAWRGRRTERRKRKTRQLGVLSTEIADQANSSLRTTAAQPFTAQFVPPDCDSGGQQHLRQPARPSRRTR